MFRHVARHLISPMFFCYKKVERRPVVHPSVRDTIVTIDNRRTANVTIVQIARTDNETETGSEMRATFFCAFIFVLLCISKFCMQGSALSGAAPLFFSDFLLYFYFLIILLTTLGCLGFFVHCVHRPLLCNFAERRPVVHPSVRDTNVTIDNRRTANVTTVQIARTDNETETGG